MHLEHDKEQIQLLYNTHYSSQVTEKYIIRLNTIADYTKVMVIEDGRVAEYGTPFELLTNDFKNPRIN